MAKSRATRWIQLSKMAQNGHHFSASELAKRLGVSRRTIFRYRKVLKDAASDAEMPTDVLINGNGRGQVCRPALSEHEVIALALAVSNSPVSAMDEYREAVETGLEKLLGVASSELRDRIAACVEQYRSAGPARPVNHHQRLPQAARRRKSARVNG